MMTTTDRMEGVSLSSEFSNDLIPSDIIAAATRTILHRSNCLLWPCFLKEVAVLTISLVILIRLPVRRQL